MEWIILALLAAATMATQVEANRHYNCDGLQLNFWRAAFATVFFAIPCVFIEWPADWKIYALAVFDGVGAVFTCTLLFNLAARKQSRVSSLYSPLATLVSLLFWLAISTAEQDRLLTHPQAALLIFAALGIAAYGLNRFRANDASWAALIAVLPVGIFYGFADVLARLLLAGHDIFAAVTVLGFVASLTSAIVNAGVLQARGSLAMPGSAMLKGGVVIAILSVVFAYLFTAAILMAPNPAYPGFFMMTMPVMLLIYHRMSAVDDNADWRAALLIVAGAVVASLQAIWFV